MNFVVSQILQKRVNQRSVNQLTKKLWSGKGSTTELMDVNDPKFALRIFTDPKIEGRIAMGIVGTVRNFPSERLIHDKQIAISRPHHFGLSAGRPFPDGPLIVVMLRRSLKTR
jgi:hypothetical protein